MTRGAKVVKMAMLSQGGLFGATAGAAETRLSLFLERAQVGVAAADYYADAFAGGGTVSAA